MEEGVPQGSDLIMKLFTLGLNNMVFNISTPVRYSLYVSDLAIYISGVELSYLVRNLTKWCDTGGFLFSFLTRSLSFSIA